MPLKRITIATRGSALALWQARHIQARLEAEYPGALAVELLILKTTGDKILDVPLAKVGGKGLFVKEIEDALLDGRADLAVHSMKDVPMDLPPGLALGAIPEREDPTDAFLSVRHPKLAALPHGARVGTSSLRRQAQLLALRPDLEIASLRGNVDTRLRKLTEGQFDAILLASAGMKRMELSAPHQETLCPPDFLPAVGQGALGIEFKEDRQDLRELLAFLDHRPTSICVTAERAFLKALDGGCQVPIAAYAEMAAEATFDLTGPDSFHLTGLIAAPDGSRVLRAELRGTADQAAQSGQQLAQNLLSQGGGEILQLAYSS